MSLPLPSTPQLKDVLLSTRNQDGGWGYQAGKASRLEPTCWALLALRERADASVLSRWPALDGLLLERQGGSANYAFHGLALLTLRALNVSHAAGDEALLRGIQSVRGVKLPQSELTTQDNSLQGWSWIADTFSWVEPTAWCLLALKSWSNIHAAAVDAKRMDVAERLLIDRHCSGGGWNYGNANVYGQQLKAFVPTTAIGLLSLQHLRARTEVQQGVSFLERHCTAERSGPALSLALVALTMYGSPATAAAREAATAQIPTTLAFGNQMAAAMLLFSLTSENYGAFVI